MSARKPATAAGLPVADPVIKPTRGSSVEIAVTANTEQAVANINQLGTALKAATAPKPGWATTEFWIALTPIVAAALTVFHVTAAPTQVRDVLIAVAGLLGAVYTISRSQVKKAHANAVAQTVAVRQANDAGHSGIGIMLFVVILLAALLLGGFGSSWFFLLIIVALLALFL